MDPESLLFAEVIGMVGIAGFLTLSLRGGKEPGSTDVAGTLQPISTAVLCPGWKCNAEVIIGVRDDGPEVRLGILACDLLLEGESCDEGCITQVARA
jgi:hypothetical protein